MSVCADVRECVCVFSHFSIRHLGPSGAKPSKGALGGFVPRLRSLLPPALLLQVSSRQVPGGVAFFSLLDYVSRVCVCVCVCVQQILMLQ